MATSTALSIIRCSGDQQDETTQRDSCKLAAEREELTLIGEIQLHSVSGYKGDKRHLAALDEALARVRSGEVSAVVVAHSSRAARLPHRDVLRWIWDLEEAGGRIVSHDENSWARTGADVMDDTRTMWTAAENRKKSEDISMHTRRAFRSMDKQGYHRGWALAGYEITCQVCGDVNRCQAHKQFKKLVPHPVAGPAVTDAFMSAASGVGTPVIARKFLALNVRYGTKLPTTADGVGNMLHMTEFSTGHHRDGVSCQCTFPPLVSPEQQNAAIAALKARTTGKAVSTRAISQDDYSGALWCGLCGGTPFANPNNRMYRKFAGKHLDDTKTSRRYCCKSCKKSVLAHKADSEVNRIMSGNTAWWYTAATQDMNAERDRLIANLDYQLDNLNAHARVNGWTREQKRQTENELYAERDKLAAVPDQPAITHAVHVTDDNGRQLTEGDHWDRMSYAERRDYLMAGSVYVYVRASNGDVVVDVEREQ